MSLKRFALVGVQLTGIRSKEGVIKLGFGLDQDDSDLLKLIREILKNNDQGGGTLDSISVRDARLAFRDEPTGLFIVSPESNFTVQNTNGRLDASVDSMIEISGVPSHLAAQCCPIWFVGNLNGNAARSGRGKSEATATLSTRGICFSYAVRL